MQVDGHHHAKAERLLEAMAVMPVGDVVTFLAEALCEMERKGAADVLTAEIKIISEDVHKSVSFVRRKGLETVADRLRVRLRGLEVNV